MRSSRRRIAASAAAPESDGIEQEGGRRRSSRARMQTEKYANNENSDREGSSKGDDSHEVEEISDGSDQEAAAPVQLRKSSRTNAFRGAMKDPTDSIQDLLKRSDAFILDPPKRRGKSGKKTPSMESSGNDDEDDDEAEDESEDDENEADDDDEEEPSKRITRRATSSKKGALSPTKSPAKRHTKQRKSKRLEYPISEEESSEDEYEDSDSDEDDNEDMKIHRIIAAKTLTLKEWQEVCKNINTTEITNGSRWNQEEDTRDPEKYEERFLVKWQNLSFLHCSWETEGDLVELIDNAKVHLNTFFRKSVNGLLYDADERLDGDYFDPSWLQVERIMEVDDSIEGEDKTKGSKKKDAPIIEKYNIILDVNDPDFENGTGRQFYVKWLNTPYSVSTYEFERDLILNEVEYLEQLKEYEDRSKKPSKDEILKLRNKHDKEAKQLYKIFGETLKMSDEEKEVKVKEYQSKLATQVFKNGGQLRDYQAEGVSWLMSNHSNKRSSILADEMGLGKTIQTATYLNTVATQLATRGPFLIVAPLSTIPHWYREFTGWTNLNTIVYHGSANDRSVVRESEFCFAVDTEKVGHVGFNEKFLNKVQKQWKSKWERSWMVEVVITTPEMLVTDDFAELASVEWEILVVDEAHRLKNHSSKLANNLRDRRFVFKHSLLLTGTPIQNNMQELWTLLHFIDPENFGRLDDFMERYGDIKSKERVDELHETIRPYILRRLKEDVEKSVPPKEETLIEVELTVLQKQYYRALYEKNVKFLLRNKKKALDGPSINNLAMQLRKCCNHPFLLNGVEIEVKNQQPGVDVVDLLVASSGKLVLLDKLLPRLKADGHRILLFSQFKIMLDIIEDYLNLRNFKNERIDGSITGLKRQAAIDRFQSKNADGREPPFIMLLSTRAGGVGINLTAADTCIIFDSDWNPQNDLQAQARCHRIGQTKNVKIYRLLTRKTYEMQMFHMSSLKMGLDQAVLQGIENTGGNKEVLTKEEVEKLLKHGAYDIFKEDKDGTSEKESNDFISQDIDSILERRTKTVVHENTGSKSNAAGGTFSKASFKTTNADGVAAEEVDVDDPQFWQKVVGDKVEEDKQVELTGQKRKRAKTNYSERDYLKELDAQILNGTGASDDDDSSAASSGYNNIGNESVEDTFEYDLIENDDLKKIIRATKSKNKKERHTWGGMAPNEWTQPDAEQVLKGLMSFGYNNIPLDSFISSLSLSRSYKREEIKRMCWAIPLLCLYEVAKDNAFVLNESRKRATESNQNDGCSLSQSGMQPQSNKSGDSSADPKDQLRQSLDKLLHENNPWVSKALEDAIAFSKTVPPRDKNFVRDVLDGMYSTKKHSESNEVQSMLTEVFNESIWPALRSRGWKEVEGSKRRFSYQGNTFNSIASVLNILPRHHPEIMKMVDSVISSVSAKCSSDVDVTPALDVKNIAAEDMESFLNNYAPLQLIADRIRAHRIGLSKRILTTLKILHGVHSMVSLADSKLPSDASIRDLNNQLAALIKINSRAARPHPEWTVTHDAILIRAIAKHGWIDRQASVLSIGNDKSIQWGRPFEACADADGRGEEDVKDSDFTDVLLKVAERAASLLNNQSELVHEFRGIQSCNLVKAYCLKRVNELSDKSDEEEGEHPEKTTSIWEVDKDKLSSTKVDNGCEELPPRKQLYLRAKKIILGFIDDSEGDEEEKENLPEEATTVKAPVKRDDHGFGVLDVNCIDNFLLSEMLRGLLKSTSRHSVKSCNLLVTQILDEINERMEECKSDFTATAELEKIKDTVPFYIKTVRKNSRAAKNIVRVMLGIDPVPPKDPADSLFPEMKTKKKKHKNKKGVSDVAKAALNKVKKNALTPADNALCRAIKSLKDATRETTDILRLTSTEVLMLTVLSSQGLPVFCDEWSGLVISETIFNEDIESDGFQIYFFAMGGVMEAAAEVWLKIAKTKLQEKLRLLEDNNHHDTATRQKLLEDIAILQKDHDAKISTLEESKKFNQNPQIFARKAVMLLEAVRKNMGPVDLQYAGEKKIRSLNKSENGLGTKILNWFHKEIIRWSKPLGIVDKAGNVLCGTSIGVDMDHLQSHDAAMMTKRDCRTVFIQVAQQSRLRSIFIKNKIERMASELIPKAMKQSTFSDDDWEDRPEWWNSESNAICACQDDLDLLIGILDYGYGGFDCMLNHDFQFCQRVKAEGKKDSKALFTRAAAQTRVNHLTRELHVIDDSEEMTKLVQDRSSRNKSDSPNNSNAGKKTTKSRSGVQPGLHAFFKRPSAESGSPTPNKKQKTPPTSPGNDGDHEVIALDIDSDSSPSTGKRKNDHAGESPENKKQK